MTSPRQLRLSAAFGRRATGRAGSPSFAERLLQALGAHPAFTDAVLGDLAEERARRREEDGPTAAGWWYVREACRSAPHLLWNALRHGGPRGRARAAAVLAAVALVPALASFALLRDAPPARLVVDGQNGGADGIVLNSTHPVQLAMRALDAKGRAMPSVEVQYRWLSGMPLPVTSSGVVTCTHSGDAMLHASVGAVETTVLLHCRPVKEFLTQMWTQLVAGGPGRNLTFTAVGPDGRPVDLLAFDLRVGDTTVATLTGSRIRPVAPGQTFLVMRIGDAETITGVIVYEPVPTLGGLRPDQRFVVAPVAVARGDTIRWSLPKGLFWLIYEPASTEQTVPTLAVDGPVMCMPDFSPEDLSVSCLVRGPGASLRITHPGTPTPAIAGKLALALRGQP